MLDRALGGLLVLLGCVHNFVAAPLSYQQLTPAATQMLDELAVDERAGAGRTSRI